MSLFTILTPSEQVAMYLKEELLRGRWAELIPGVPSLAKELGVDPKTVGIALTHLEREGLLISQGPGRRRLIKLPDDTLRSTLRVAILDNEPLELKERWLLELQHLLEEGGHRAFFASKTLTDLGMDVGRIARFVQKSEANAWVVVSASRGVLEWFADQPVPAFAIAGRRRGLPMAGAGPDKTMALGEATRRLIELGHRRIVLLTRRQRRLPEPGASERVFLAELEAAGIPTGSFNLPDWEESIDGLQKVLDSLFGKTPPTAMFVDEALFFTATQQYLARRGYQVPGDVSLICSDGDPTFQWCQPSISHIHWDHRPMLNLTVRWATGVQRGKNDRKQSPSKADFVEGGTIGPVSRK